MNQSKEKGIDVFEDLSVVLTGFSKADLAGTGLLKPYFHTVKKELGCETVEALLSVFQKYRIADPEHLTAKELRDVQGLFSDKPYSVAITQIIKLWYLGEWLNPDNSGYIISPQSYLEGLIWKAIAAHPMAGKQPGYGTWSFPPLTFLSDSTTP